MASLYATGVNGDDHIVLDDEGGAKATNLKSRFIAPTLAVMATFVATSRDPQDAGEPGVLVETPGANIGGRSAGGFAGLGLIGVLIGQASNPVAIGLGAVGAVESLYLSLIGKGREVSFPADTLIEVQLSATPAPLK